MTELVDVLSNDPTGSSFVPHKFEMKLNSVSANYTEKQSHMPVLKESSFTQECHLLKGLSLGSVVGQISRKQKPCP